MKTLSTYTAICTVEDAYAHIGCYLVSAPNRSQYICADLYHNGTTPMGARPIGGYPCKSQVLVLFDPHLEFPIILGASPKGLADGRTIIPESMVLRSRAGQFEDPMHNSELKDTSLVWANFSGGRPCDTIPGDYGFINDMGLAVFIGKLMASIKASDSAKVEAFWGDDLLRLVGYNYELFTAGREFKAVNDEGEYNEIDRSTPFIWESLGLAKKGEQAVKETDGRLEPGSEEASFEPQEDDQLIIPRQTLFKGYLGDVEKEFISAPPDDMTVETFSSKTKHTGLLEVIKSGDGLYGIRSAKGIILEKYCLIPVPKETKVPEDPTGDSKEDGYVPAGSDVSIPDFKYGDETKPGIRGPQVYDYLSYVFGRYTCAGLAKKTKDWYYPEESEVSKPVSSTTYDKGLSQLESQFELDLPGSEVIKVDHRGGRESVKYYKSRSLFAQLDDGSIIIEDGYGSGIYMTGGNIYTKAPGDIWTMSGRSAITWAGFDSITKAGNCVDVSASKGDVRLKADRNLHVLGGNSGSIGGVLIESRSEGEISTSDFSEVGQRVTSHGVIIKAKNSPVHVYGQSVFVGVTPGQGGNVVIDADENTTYLRGKAIVSKITEIFSVYNKDEKALMALGPGGAVISTQLMIGGNVIIADLDDGTASLVVGGSIIAHESIAADGAIVTNGAFASFVAPAVAKLDRREDLGQSPQELADNISQQVNAVEDYTQKFEEQYKTGDNAPGKSDFQDSIGFSCRESKEDFELDESSFIIYESRWQQMLTNGGKTWEEPIVTAPDGTQTMPHPGKEAWSDWNAYSTVDLKNFDISSGKTTGNREDLSEEGSEQQKKSLESGYKVVKGPSN